MNNTVVLNDQNDKYGKKSGKYRQDENDERRDNFLIVTQEIDIVSINELVLCL